MGKRSKNLRTAVALGLCALPPLTLQGATVTGNLGIDPSSLAGTDGLGRVLLFAPNPVQPGSSISHWDRSATPNLLMEPSASANLPFPGLDLTRPLMFDIGWAPGSSNVFIRNMDGQGEGLNDPQLGAQRMQAMQFAAQVWSNNLRSSIAINVDVSFSNLDCDTSGGVLAQAGPQFVFENFAGAPVGNTFYAGALAESLASQNLSLQDDPNATAGDLALEFNSQIDQACLGAGSRYYYGLDGNEPPGTINFVQVALHEMAHGLGFTSFVNERNGALFFGRPDIFTRNILDNSNGLRWHQMNNGQRAASAINTGRVVWAGQQVTNAAPSFLQAGPALILDAPASVAGRYLIGTAEFGPAIANPGITGQLVIARDGSNQPTLACNPIVNGGEIAGRIAVVDRGTCNFTVKVRNAQNAGARAVVVVNNVGGGVINMGGTDGSIDIPSAMVSRNDGNRIKTAINSPEEPPDSAGELQFTSAAVTINEGQGAVTLGVSRVDGTAGQVSASFATAGGSATSGQDFAASNGTVTFGDGSSNIQNVVIPILEDTIAEASESFTVTLSNPTGDAEIGAPSTATVTITDNEPCVESDTISCLDAGRFKVQIDWRDFGGDQDDARRVPVVSDDSALYYFFEPDNWEMLVKVLDGCSFNNHFWVFAAATTNVEYSLTVTDTQEGETFFFQNPLGNPSEALTEIEAFATCP